MQCFPTWFPCCSTSAVLPPLQSSHLCTLLSSLLFLFLQSWAKLGELPRVPFPGTGAGTPRGMWVFASYPQGNHPTRVPFKLWPGLPLYSGVLPGPRFLPLSSQKASSGFGSPTTIFEPRSSCLNALTLLGLRCSLFLSRNSAHFLLPISFSSQFHSLWKRSVILIPLVRCLVHGWLLAFSFLALLQWPLEFHGSLPQTSLLPSICLNTTLPVAMPFAFLTFLSSGSKFQRGYYCLSGQKPCPVAGRKALIVHLPWIRGCQNLKGWHLGKF